MTAYINYKPSNKGLLKLSWPLQSSALEQISPPDSNWNPAPTNSPVNGISLCRKWQGDNWLTSTWKEVLMVTFYITFSTYKHGRAPVIPSLYSLSFTHSLNIMFSLPWQLDLNKTFFLRLYTLFSLHWWGALFTFSFYEYISNKRKYFCIWCILKLWEQHCVKTASASPKYLTSLFSNALNVQQRTASLCMPWFLHSPKLPDTGNQIYWIPPDKGALAILLYWYMSIRGHVTTRNWICCHGMMQGALSGDGSE